jgi:pimeloyl-ACP methyl ester carboxylesterase/DNA-binding CsgD family transcriptional regulator
MYDDEANQLIELIYESAIKPSKWPDLLNSLAELVDHVEKQSNKAAAEKSMLSVVPGITSIDTKESNVSISETLKSITDIKEKETQNSSAGIGQVNDLLMGHFARAIKIAKRLVDIDEQHNVVLSLLDRMPIALVLVDAKARVIETNTLADEMLSSESGLNVKSNVLDSGIESNERLLETIEQMSKHDHAITPGQALSITDEQTKNNIMLFIAPLKQHDSQQKASVAVFISQRKAQPLSLPQQFAELYSLTNKEQNVTEQLVRGLSIKEISEETSVSQHTVRSQVKSVLHKTQTSRQAELVSLVYNGMGDFVNSIPDDHQDKREGLLSKRKVWQQNYNILQLDDGRNLAYTEYGDLNGEPVFHCHSVLGSRQEQAFNAQQISEQKAVRVIVMDRPGYGASDPDPKTSFINWAKDLVQLADYLNIEKFSLTGYAMGGLYALACAHEMPERLKRVAIIGTGMTPGSSKDFEKMIPLYKMNTRLAKYVPKVYNLLSSVLIKGVLSDPAGFFEQFTEILEQADRDIVDSKAFKTEMFATLREGFRQGGNASSRDVIQFMHDWSFELSKINIPIDIWHGSNDYHIPILLGKRFTEHIKNTTLFIKEGQGHYMFYTHWSEILDELLLSKS